MTHLTGTEDVAEPQPGFLDGNAAAGLLSEVFAVDMTSAMGCCASCGDRAVVARARLYPDDHGLVLSCSACGAVLLRATEHQGRLTLDLHGMAWIEVAPG